MGELRNRGPGSTGARISNEVVWSLADLFRDRVIRFQIFFTDRPLEEIIEISPSEDWNFECKYRRELGGSTSLQISHLAVHVWRWSRGLDRGTPWTVLIRQLPANGKTAAVEKISGIRGAIQVSPRCHMPTFRQSPRVSPSSQTLRL